MAEIICPLMSKPVVTGTTHDVPEIHFVVCEKENCQLWSTVYTTEHTQISGCSIEMVAHKNQDGLYAV